MIIQYRNNRKDRCMRMQGAHVSEIALRYQPRGGRGNPTLRRWDSEMEGTSLAYIMRTATSTICR